MAAAGRHASATGPRRPMHRGSAGSRIIRPLLGLWITLVPTLASPAGSAGELRTPGSPRPLVISVETRLGASTAPPAFRAVVGLDAALDLVAELRTRWPDRPIVLDLAPGLYRLSHPLHIGPEHSGAASATLTIRGASGRRSRILGSMALAPAPFMLGPALAARLPPVAREHVRAYRLPEAALASPRIRSPKLLRSRPDALGLSVFDQAGELTPARWPNEGWGRVAVGTTDAAQPSFSPDAERLVRWRGEPDLWAEGYWRWPWLFESLPVTGVDPILKRMTLPELPYEGILAGSRFRVSHALSELDHPGEWWRDRADGILLAWPRARDETLDVSVTDTLFKIENASHVRIEDLDLAESRGDLVTVSGGSDVVIQRSRLAFAGGRAAVFTDALSSGLDDCEIEDIGRVAVRLSGGDRPTLTPGGLFVRNSRLTRWALRSRTQSPAIEIDGVGAVVQGNVIHDGIDAALHIHGNDHRIVGNEIARVVVGSSDNGAIYAGRDWTARGTLIEDNVLHDIRAENGAETKGIYLDDEASGFTVRHNLFLRVDQAVFIGGGRDNLIQGNVFVASSPSIHIDSRGQTWAAGAIGDPASELRRAYAAMPVSSPRWRERYPGLAEILLDRPEVAKANRLEQNVFVLGRDFHIGDGGQASEQVFRSNTGPDGIGFRMGHDLAAAARDSSEPSDFADLIDREGTRVAPFDLGRMRHSTVRAKADDPHP